MRTSGDWQEAPRTSLTLDGLLHQIAALERDLEEEPIAVAFRAEPTTLARFLHELRQHLPTPPRPPTLLMPSGPGYFDGIRLEEDNDLPPRPPGRVDVIDHKGLVMQKLEI